MIRVNQRNPIPSLEYIKRIFLVYSGIVCLAFTSNIGAQSNSQLSADALNSRAEEDLNARPDSALYFAIKALERARDGNETVAELKALNLMSQAYFQQSKT